MDDILQGARGDAMDIAAGPANNDDNPMDEEDNEPMDQVASPYITACQVSTAVCFSILNISVQDYISLTWLNHNILFFRLSQLAVKPHQSYGM